MKAQQKLFFLGVGNTARWVAQQCADRYTLCGTTRDAEKATTLERAAIAPFLLPGDDEVLEAALAEAYLLVSYPPDKGSDERFSRLVDRCKAIIYISSTGVYGRQVGVIDENSPVDADYEPAQARLEQERIWLERGAIVLRAPGLYCPSSGLHVRLANGAYRLPADGSNYTSRIHLKDLGRLILAAFEQQLPSRSIFVVGDLKPATQSEVVTWLCERMHLPLPAVVPLDSVPKSLRANRRVLPAKILSQLQFELEFPTYEEGFAHCLKVFEQAQR